MSRSLEANGAPANALAQAPACRSRCTALQRGSAQGCACEEAGHGQQRHNAGRHKGGGAAGLSLVHFSVARPAAMSPGAPWCNADSYELTPTRVAAWRGGLAESLLKGTPASSPCPASGGHAGDEAELCLTCRAAF